MQSNIYVALSAQLALQRRLDTVANNVANASTAGYRAEEMSFEELLSEKGKEPVSFVSKGDSIFPSRWATWSKRVARSTSPFVAAPGSQFRRRRGLPIPAMAGCR